MARDAFNGTVLWKRPIPEWNTQLWPLKSGPNQLPRRLVAVGDRVYVTLGIDAPSTALDAATGKTIAHLRRAREHTDELLASEGTLFLLVAHRANKWKTYRPKFTFVWANTDRANRDWAWDQAPRSIMAVEAATGAVRWKQNSAWRRSRWPPTRGRVVFYDGDKAVCLTAARASSHGLPQPVLAQGALSHRLRPDAGRPPGRGPALDRDPRR